MHTCYLLGLLDDQLKIIGVQTCGEPPWTMTKHVREDYVILFIGRGETYDEALRDAQENYEWYLPKIADVFPFPEFQR